MRQICAIPPEDTHTCRGAASIAGVDLDEQVLKAHPSKDLPTRTIGDLE